MNTPKAIALTWDAEFVRIRCPYSCPTGIHSHGFIRPKSGIRNMRAPHCTPKKDDDGRHVFSRDYRILFPFEEDPVTEGMWWELDHRKKRWRTVSWQTYDPEYGASCDDTEPQSDDDAPNELGTQTSEEDETGIENAFSSLGIHDTQARIDHEAELESRDRDGNTALLSALKRGHGMLAERLVTAGANISVSNNDGKIVRDMARASLERQKEIIRIGKMMIHPREPPLVRYSINKDQVQKDIDARSEEARALQRIITSSKQRQAREQFLVRLRRIGQMYGEEQAEAVERHGALDDQALLVRLLIRVVETPRDTVWRTVACLARGTVFPWIFAISGYSDSVLDGLLPRATWKERVFDLAEVIGHDLRADYRDGRERAGSFFACHSEKQLLAYFVWNHTTKLSPHHGGMLQQSEPREMLKLYAEIYFA